MSMAIRMLLIMAILVIPGKASSENFQTTSDFILFEGSDISVHKLYTNAIDIHFSLKNDSRSNWMQEEDTNTSGRQGVVLFKPLLADPKWPHFSVGYGNIHNHVDLRHGIRVSLGEIIPLFHFEDGRGGYYQIAIEGAVFSLFDIAVRLSSPL